MTMFLTELVVRAWKSRHLQDRSQRQPRRKRHTRAGVPAAAAASGRALS